MFVKNIIKIKFTCQILKGISQEIVETSMSVKLTKSPAEQQSHNHGIQLNANKPLSHNCRVKDREILGQCKVVNIKVLM